MESQKDDNDLDVDEVNMRCCSIAGGPILLDLLTLPPQPKIANNWTIKQGGYSIMRNTSLIVS